MCDEREKKTEKTLGTYLSQAGEQTERNPADRKVSQRERQFAILPAPSLRPD